MNMVKHPWFDTARDVVHTNWMAVADVEWQTYDWGDPLRCVASYAAQTVAQRASIRPELLQHNYRWSRSELANLLRAYAPSLGWAVVFRDHIVVHATNTADRGLFGLQGDAPVQLVQCSLLTRATRRG